MNFKKSGQWAIDSYIETVNVLVFMRTLTLTPNGNANSNAYTYANASNND